MTTNFQHWDHDSLARFAAESRVALATQDSQIEQLKTDLRLALDAWRELLKEKTE